MAKITAVIDIGSNSVRMAVFERTSRFGFHLLKEAKARVRISENAWRNGGQLQEAAMLRAEAALQDFVSIAHAFKARKVFAVATSAVRDAPNKSDFIQRIKARTGLQIRVISGEEEARLGGLAAVNLLPVTDGVTVDIGGGSTELALIENGRVVECLSFALGTVRLKELFFDDKSDVRGALRYVSRTLSDLPPRFLGKQIIGVGGTLRALSSVLMKRERYPFEVLHAYRFDLLPQRRFLADLIRSDVDGLKRLGFKSERLDVIREGVLILTRVARKIGAQGVITSGVGVREGLFLSDMLRSSAQHFPVGFDPSVRSLSDRFMIDGTHATWLSQTALRLFETLLPMHQIDSRYKKCLSCAAKLLPIGDRLNHYDRAENGYFLTYHGLGYGFEHHERILIAKLIKAQQKKELIAFAPSARLARLLPSSVTVRWLALALYLANMINSNRTQPPVSFHLEGRKLIIDAPKGLGSIAEGSLRGLKLPFGLTLEF